MSCFRFHPLAGVALAPSALATAVITADNAAAVYLDAALDVGVDLDADSDIDLDLGH